MKSIAYKVVVEKNSALHSFNIINNSNYSLIYELNKVILPKIGKIFAFETLENAKQFKQFADSNIRMEIFKIFKARVENATPSFSCSFGYDINILEFWENILLPQDFWFTPNGTLFCDSLELIEEIKSY